MTEAPAGPRAGIFQLLVESGRRWNRGRAPAQSAALAFYTLLALGPLLVLTFGLASSFFGQEVARGGIETQVENLLGAATAAVIARVFDSAVLPSYRGLAGLVGLVALFVGATSVFNQLQEALNDIWGVKRRLNKRVQKFFLKRLLSFALVLVIGLLLMASLFASTALAAVRSVLEGTQQELTALVPLADLALSVAMVTVFFAAIYRALPDATVGWRDVWVGALVTSLLFSGGKILIGAYLGRSNYLTVYGVAGSVVLSLLWIYYSWMVLLVGAGFTRAWSLRGAAEGASAQQPELS